MPGRIHTHDRFAPEMTGETLVAAAPAPARQRLIAQGLGTPAPIGFLILHVAGGAYALVTLVRAVILWGVVRLLAKASVLLGALAPVWFLVLVGIALVAM